MNASSNPKVTFGMPILNGAEHVASCIQSILAQTYDNLELVISDNGSTDGTIEIIERFAREDPRVRVHKNPANIGQNPNFNLVFDLSDGDYFRWIGMDDWVEPNYTTLCVERLQANPDAIGVTTYQLFIDDDGNEFYAEFDGERVDSDEAHRRFSRMLWLLNADYRFIDPIYSFYRRDALASTPRLRVVPKPDQVLSVDIALAGPILHISECLCGRRRVPTHYLIDHTEEYQPGHGAKLADHPMRLAWIALKSSFQKEMPLMGRLLCLGAAARFVGVRYGRRLKTLTRRIAPEPMKKVVRSLRRRADT